MKFAWIDLRTVSAEHREGVIDAAVHARVDGIVDSDPATLATLPATVKRILVGPEGPESPEGPGSPVSQEAQGGPDGPGAQEGRENPGGGQDAPGGPGGQDGLIVLRTVAGQDDLNLLRSRHLAGDKEIAALVDVVDDPTLTLACDTAIALPYTVVRFKDPTKIPLEIVIAAADRSPGQLICKADDLEEAQVIVDVLEKGSEGVLFAPRDANDVFALVEMLRVKTPDLQLTTLTVESTEHIGLGDRVCIDTCTHFEKDEGMLIGSYAHGFVLCVSETHPLPYMPTRPFRINAGALHSYVFGQDNRTNYLSELKAGSAVLAVGADGRTRRIVVGRIKLESRPLLSIKAVSPEGVEVNLIVQDDWHVRVLGPGAAVLNVTELKKGDQVLGHVATDKRHVGWPVGEFCVEK